MEFELPDVCALLANPMRLQIIRELALGIPLPAAALVRRLGSSAPLVSRQLAYLRTQGVTEIVHGRLHRLTPAFQPAPGAKVLDLRQVLLVLQPADGPSGERSPDL